MSLKETLIPVGARFCDLAVCNGLSIADGLGGCTACGPGRISSLDGSQCITEPVFVKEGQRCGSSLGGRDPGLLCEHPGICSNVSGEDLLCAEPTIPPYLQGVITNGSLEMQPVLGPMATQFPGPYPVATYTATIRGNNLGLRVGKLELQFFGRFNSNGTVSGNYVLMSMAGGAECYAYYMDGRLVSLPPQNVTTSVGTVQGAGLSVQSSSSGPGRRLLGPSAPADTIILHVRSEGCDPKPEIVQGLLNGYYGYVLAETFSKYDEAKNRHTLTWVQPTWEAGLGWMDVPNEEALAFCGGTTAYSNGMDLLEGLGTGALAMATGRGSLVVGALLGVVAGNVRESKCIPLASYALYIRPAGGILAPDRDDYRLYKRVAFPQVIGGPGKWTLEVPPQSEGDALTLHSDLICPACRYYPSFPGVVWSRCNVPHDCRGTCNQKEGYEWGYVTASCDTDFHYYVLTTEGCVPNAARCRIPLVYEPPPDGPEATPGPACGCISSADCPVGYLCDQSAGVCKVGAAANYIPCHCDESYIPGTGLHPDDLSCVGYVNLVLNKTNKGRKLWVPGYIRDRPCVGISEFCYFSMEDGHPYYAPLNGFFMSKCTDPTIYGKIACPLGDSGCPAGQLCVYQQSCPLSTGNWCLNKMPSVLDCSDWWDSGT